MKQVFIALSLLLLIACGQADTIDSNGDETAHAEKKAPLYQNQLYQVEAINGWTIEEETVTEKEQNVSFINDNTKVIITTTNNEQSNDQLKSKFLSSFSKNATIVKEKENYVRLETNRNENIFGDIYIHQGSDFKVVLIFMTPEQDYDKEKIQSFNEKIELF
ncbi:hypothetical protein [Gracilibacillus massiliensis]|uniref:hypothetical protein n=1 Tax=Gracilibacillus massiliensis TaxID=1564956 RepID=UPI00071CE75E|nr:hypothetical protein [Gracilibacillus massiliensis]